MKFLADECIYVATVKLLRDFGYDVISIKELNLSSLSDEKVLELAKGQAANNRKYEFCPSKVLKENFSGDYF